MESMLEKILEQYSEEELLQADGYDEAIIGVCEDVNKPPRLIYSVKKMVEILAKQMDVKESDLEEGENIEDKKVELAQEYLVFNTFGAYVGEKTPVWCHDNL